MEDKAAKHPGSIHGTLIRTKLRPRPPVEAVLPRDHVLERLCEAPLPTLTLLSAPAGYGKTTLMSQWWHRLRDSGARVAWLSLDSNDATPAALFSYMIASLHEAGIDMGDLMTAARTRLMDTAVQDVLSELINCLSKVREPVYIFLDDYQSVTSPAIDALLSEMVDYIQGKDHLIVSARNRPTLNTAKLRAMRDVREFYAQDLKFSARESESFFGYSDDTTSSLTDIAEGWPAALQLGRLWIERQQSSGREGGRLEFTGRSVDLAAYLMEQVFADLPPNLQERLSAISILERFNGDLINSICQVSDGWSLVDVLESENLFVNALDEERNWFSLHQLFREFLAERLKRKSHSEIDELYARAVDWFKSHGYIEEALLHAQRSNSPRLIAGVLQHIGGWTVAFREGVQPLSRLTDIPVETALEYPIIGLTQVYVLLQSGEVASARYLHQQLRDRCPPGSADGQNTMAISMMFLQNLLQLYECEPPSLDDIAELRRLLAAQTEPGFPVKAMTDILECYIHYQHGNYRACIETGLSAREIFARQRAFYGVFFVHCYVGLAQCELGLLDDAQATVEEGLRVASEHYSVHCNQVKIARVLLADIAYQRNQLDDARDLLKQPIDAMWENGAWFNILSAGLITKASLMIHDGQLDEAFFFFDLIDHYATAQGIPRLRQMLLVLRARLLLRCGREDEARTLSEGEVFQEILGQTRRADSIFSHLYDPALVIWSLLQAREGQVGAALDTLEALSQNAERNHHLKTEVQTRLSMALLCCEQGGAKEAFRHLSQALKRAAGKRLVRLFLDEGEPMISLLRQFVTSRGKHDSEALRCARQLLEQAGQTETAANGGFSRITGAGLSGRESQVLDLLSKGFSSKEMARELDLSEGTVKVHRKRLYRKLGAHNRSTALAAARANNL